MFFQPDTYVKFKIGPSVNSEQPPAMNSSWPPLDGAVETGIQLLSHRGGLFTPSKGGGNTAANTTLPHLPNQGQVCATVWVLLKSSYVMVIKIVFQCHRTQVRDNTVDPKWVGEFFKFVAFKTDFLEIEVKDKVAKPNISRIMGKRRVLLSTILPSSTNRQDYSNTPSRLLEVD